MFTTYQQYKERKENQNILVDSIEAKLKVLPKNEMGLVLDEIKQTNEYKILVNTFKTEFAKLQIINQNGNKLFKKEILQDIQNKRNN